MADVIHINTRTASADELQQAASMLLSKAREKAVAEDEAYRKFLAERRAALNVGDKIGVTINGRQYVAIVRGFDRNYYGLPFVKFRIDWDEGPIDYCWNVSLVEKVKEASETTAFRRLTLG